MDLLLILPRWIDLFTIIFATTLMSLRDYDGQVAEAMTMMRALNKMTKVGMPESTIRYGETYPKSDLFNKAFLMTKFFLVYQS